MQPCVIGTLASKQTGVCLNWQYVP